MRCYAGSNVLSRPGAASQPLFDAFDYLRYGNRCQMGDAPRGIAVVAHGGGPTPVLNSSLVGVINECRKHSEITALYGATQGLAGILSEHFLDLGKQDPSLIGRIGEAPS